MGPAQLCEAARRADREYLRAWHARSEKHGADSDPSCRHTIRCLNTLIALYPLAQCDASPLAILKVSSEDPKFRITSNESGIIRREWCAVARSVALMRSIAIVRPNERGTPNYVLQNYLSLLAIACRDDVLRADQVRGLILGNHGRTYGACESASDRRNATTKSVKSLVRSLEGNGRQDPSDMAALVGLIGVIHDRQTLNFRTCFLKPSTQPTLRSLGPGVDKGYGRWGRRSLIGSLSRGGKDTWRSQFLDALQAYGFVPGVAATKNLEAELETTLRGYGQGSVRGSMRGRAALTHYEAGAEKIAIDRQELKYRTQAIYGQAPEPLSQSQVSAGQNEVCLTSASITLPFAAAKELLKAREMIFSDNTFHDEIASRCRRSKPLPRLMTRIGQRLG